MLEQRLEFVFTANAVFEIVQ